MRAGAAAARIVLAVALAACEPPPDASAPGPSPSCAARGTDLDVDLEVQAWAALARDAWLRDERFREALAPGRAFGATRVEQADVEAGRVSPEALFRVGGALFELRVDRALGAGSADRPVLSRVHAGPRGGPDARHCGACHRRGGPAGAGDAANVSYYDGDGDAPSSALARDAPSLAGAGAIELVAREMTAALAAQRDAAIAEASRRGASVRAVLDAQGLSFGVLVAGADGTLDTSDVRGVAADLVVRPFGRAGRHASLRDAVEEELALHLGMQTEHLVATGAPERIGAAGADDPDGDGVVAEITEGQLTALVLYVAMQEIPSVSVPESADLTLAAARGRARFETLGCASCHTPSLALGDARYVLPSRVGGASLVVDLATEAAEPRLAPAEGRAGWVVWAYTDLRRHDVGEALADARDRDGASASTFVTPPLWGLMRSGPYLHDARAPTVEDAILLHGGEALPARDAYAALAEPERATVRVFLATLTRARRLEVR